MRYRSSLVLSLMVSLGGCATLDGDDYAVYDTQEKFNRWSYDFSDQIDRAVLVPVAQGYQKLVPDLAERVAAEREKQKVERWKERGQEQYQT